jgi:hypothetical protein
MAAAVVYGIIGFGIVPNGIIPGKYPVMGMVGMPPGIIENIPRAVAWPPGNIIGVSGVGCPPPLLLHI